MDDDPLKDYEDVEPEGSDTSGGETGPDFGQMLQSVGVDGQTIETAKSAWQQVSPVVEKLGPDRLLFGAGVLFIAGSAFYGMRNRKD